MYGVAKNENKAFALYKELAEQNYTLAYNNLGVCYHDGLGTPVNLSKAAEYYQKAVENGNALACYNLGKMFLKGEYFTKDVIRAIELFNKGYALGDQDCKKKLDELKAQGYNVSRTSTTTSSKTVLPNPNSFKSAPKTATVNPNKCPHCGAIGTKKTKLGFWDKVTYCSKCKKKWK